MNKNNYLKTWQSLTKKEAKQFSTYLQFFFSGQKIAIQLHDYFAEKKSRMNKDFKLVHEEVFEESYEKSSDKKKVSNHLSDLQAHLKNFLIQQQVLKSDFEKEFLWLEILESRKLNQLKNSQIKHINKKASKTIARDIWHPLQVFRLLHHNYFRNDRDNVTELTYKAMFAAVDDFYISARLQLSTEAMNAQRTIGTNQLSDLDKSVFLYAREKEELSMLNQFYYNLYEFKQNPNPTHSEAEELFSFLKSNRLQLPPDEQLISLITAVNYWAKAIRAKVTNADKKVLDLYKYGIENNILVYKNTMDEAVFNNVVSIACMQKDYAWAQSFVNDYYHVLPSEIQKNTLHIARASIAICTGKNQDVIDLLNAIEVNDDLQHLRTHTLYIRALYLLEEFGLAQDKCNSFIKLVRRRNLPKTTIDATVNFVHLLKQFININHDRLILEKKTQAVNPLFCKDWFLEEAKKR